VTKLVLRNFHYVGILLMSYIDAAVMTMIEPLFNFYIPYYGEFRLYIFGGLLLFFSGSVLMLYFYSNLLRYIAFGLSAGVLSIFFLVDFMICEVRTKEVFYYNMLLEAVFLTIGIIVYYIKCPEGCCKKSKGVGLFFNSYIIFLVGLMNFLYELQNTFLYLIKLNEGSLSPDEQTKFIDT